ncbi:chromosome segregation protein SMC [Truepera radiovictrix]|uniref:Chromosome partition protein Smc n=1 Tax=Truepera radiovictrix (strain DSM 17093 / CIP 108686 / LMG 22925 / RQ-24) TaxID=649638 RepID=D7CXR3_TRURR|nr:chromosome segregation protein SMC [Truepera radiovictrix]ADI14665.1 SMC domain protein [Truepera radiovictrix DSM 17093]WMT56785.1 chromosome segregation protein SMC [Truepera radiovictrix]
MRLTSLTLQGFKSFADRTTLEFTEGVTAIVGPNGSGKSNLIDALRWATGGGRAEAFRAGDKTELIFHGSAGKRSLGFAEVQLEFEREGETLCVSRTLLRSGESQLRLGGRAARFLDLEEALAGSGLGRGALAVIGQGEVGSVLMADPPKLLAFLAESVGVARLAARRETTLARLAEAQEHLARLGDLRGELAARLSGLEREAADAASAAAAERERLQVRFSLAHGRVRGLREELKGLRARRAELEEAVAAGREALVEAEAERRAARAASEAAEAALRAAVAQHAARRADVRLAEERLASLGARRAALAEEAARVARDVTAGEALTPPEPPEGDEATLRDRLQTAEAQAAETQAALATLEEEVAARAAALREAQRRDADARAARSRYQAQLEALEKQRAALAADEAALEARAAASQAAQGDAAAALEAAQAERERALRALATAQEAVVALQGRHAAAVAEHQAKRTAAARLRAAFEARRGYTQGPKSALTSGIAGVFGSVADLIAVPERYRVALASALGRRAENVVVASAEVAQAVLAHVRRAGGWVTVLPLDLIQARSTRVAPELLAEGAVIGRCSELVRCDARFAAVVENLLGATLLVTTLDAGVALARRYPQRPRMVTLEGDVLEAYGALSGGRPQTAGLVLGAAAELKGAEEEAAAAEGAAAEAEAALVAQQGTLRALREARERAERALEAARAEDAKLREAAAARASLEADLERRRRALEAATRGLEPPPPLPGGDLGALEGALEAATARLQGAREGASAAQRAVAEAQRALAVWLERRSSYEAARRHFDETRARLGALRARAAELRAAQAAAADAEAEAAAALEAARAALPTDPDAPHVALAAARAREREAEGALEHLSQQQAAQRGELEALNLTVARREAALEAAEAELAAFPPGLAPLEAPARTLRERLAAAEARLAALGPVNHRAATELAALRERLTALDAQRGEGERAVRELHAVVAELDETVRARLVAGAAQLSEDFARYAEHLFGRGAAASTELLWEDGRPSGLKLALQPPGKTTRSLSLLSVGERTMGALAFLFALCAPQPGSGPAGLPLAVLDEVDAPLDEANIRRFCTFLSELSRRGTQFILITHQKATMETAGALWGVTTERGVSRVFSIRRERAA